MQARTAAQPARANEAEQQAGASPGVAAGPEGQREVEPAFAQVQRAQAQRGVGGRQYFGEQQVPQQQLQQHRDVAKGFHVQLAQTAHQGVAGEAAHTQQRAQHRGEDDAEHGHAQRVAHPHQVGFPVGVARVVGQQAFADVEAGGTVEKVKAALDTALLHVDAGVVHQVGQQRQHDGNGQQLVHHGAKGLTAPSQAAPRLGRITHGV